MWLLSILLAGELVFAIVSVSLPNNESKTLGIYKIAQEDTSTPSDSQTSTTDSQPTTQPTDTNSQPSSPEVTSTPTAPSPTQDNTNPDSTTPPQYNSTQTQDQASPSPTSLDTSSNSLPIQNDSTQTSNNSPQPSPSTNLLDQILETPSPIVSPTPGQNLSPTPEVSPYPSGSPETFPNQTEAVLNPNLLVSTPQNVDPQSASESKQEEDKLSQIQNPQEKASTTIDFASDKVKDIDRFLRKDDFASASFASQRLNYQISSVLNNPNNLKDKKLASKVTSFCNQADMVLKNAQLSVPEEAEQDVEFARAECLKTTGQ